MTLLEYVQSLQEQGVTDIPAKVQEWKKKNQPKVEEKAIEETIVEEVKIDPAAEPDATVPGATDGASASSNFGDLALNISLNEPDNSILFGWQKDIISPPKEPGVIGKLDIDLSVKPLNLSLIHI